MLQVTYLLLSLKNRLSTEREDMPCPNIQGFKRVWRLLLIGFRICRSRVSSQIEAE